MEILQMVIGGAIAIVSSVISTYQSGKNQRKNTELQLTTQSKNRLIARKQDILLESVSELITSADPELHAEYNYNDVVRNIQKIQLLLIPSEPYQGELNKAVEELGFAVQEAINNEKNNSRLLSAQDKVTVTTRALLDNLS